MTNPIRIGLIGVGGIGAYHRAAIEMQESVGAAELVAVADPWADRLGPQKAELEARGVRWHMDYRDMLAETPGLQAVVIATPIPYHLDMALACLQRGIRVHLEKPPVPLITQLDTLLAADSGHAVSVGFQMIGARTSREVKALITGGKLGSITDIRAAGCWPRTDKYYTRASWAGRMVLDGFPVFDGPASNAFAHVIHNIMYFAGQDRDGFAIPVEVEGELYRARSIESYDTACLRGRFSSGVRFSLALTHATEATLPFLIEVRGTGGWARISEDAARVESNVGLSGEHPQNTQELLNINHDNFIGVLQGRLPRFATALPDTVGYVSATNGLLASSGGIHDIAPEHFRRYERDGEGGFDVLNLHQAVQETVASGRLFSEQPLCPWATAKPTPIPLPLVHPPHL